MENINFSLFKKVQDFTRKSVALGSAMIFLSVPTLAESKTENSDINQDTAVSTDSDGLIEEPTAEVKASVTASVEDPEAKVSIEDLRAVFESYKQNLFAPYKEELKDLGCEDEARIDFCSKVLYAYDNGKDMAGGDTKDKFQNYITRDQITNYAKTGEGLEVLTNENGDPRMLMVNSTEKITQGVVDSFDYLAENGFTNALNIVSKNGGVVYFCSDGYDRGPGSFMITEYGVICSEMTDKNISEKEYEDERSVLKKINAASLYVESVGISLFQMRRAIEGMWNFGDFIGDVEVTKSLLAGYAYIGLYNKTSFVGFSVWGDDLVNMGIDSFSKKFGISPTDPRIEKQIAMLTVLVEPLTGLGWDDVPEIQKTRETYLSSN